MTDTTLVSTAALEEALEAFAAARDWRQFHSPKNLVMALTGEVGELAEVFQWMSEEDSWSAAVAPGTAQAVREELADVMLYLVRLASVLKVDLDGAVRHKLAANALKYPVDVSKGSSKKQASAATREEAP
jgi:dCTP diphosphatase